jgi:hypothetical protein
LELDPFQVIVWSGRISTGTDSTASTHNETLVKISVHLIELSHSVLIDNLADMHR